MPRKIKDSSQKQFTQIRMSSFVELCMALQVTRSAAEDLEQSMGEVFGPLRDCMDHEGVEVRKVVVRHTYIPFIHALSQKLVASAALGSRRGCGCGTCASLRLLCSASGTACKKTASSLAFAIGYAH